MVSVGQNFDSLGFPADHPGRSRTDTYYINQDTVLRTHTSAHQADIFRANASEGWLISADVYRRDAVDRSHYPVFHQMEGARTWSRSAVATQGRTLAELIWEEVAAIPTHNVNVEDPNPTIHPERNPLQATHGHTVEEVEAIAAHLKRSLEDVVVTIFSHARSAAAAASAAAATGARGSGSEAPVMQTENDEPLRVRWVEAYFPFTSPSWELEVFWQGDWLEVLGCGVVQQRILNDSGVPDRIGWAFGLGLERIAMLLYEIPDIRLFWSTDSRFLSQFTAPTPPATGSSGISRGERPIFRIARFAPFSKHPACYKDVAFWLPAATQDGEAVARPSSTVTVTSTAPATSTTTFTEVVPDAMATPSAESLSSSSSLSTSSASTPSPAGGLVTPRQPSLHENDVHSLIRDIAGSLAEDVKLVDDFTHPRTGRRSQCYRINYRSLERTLTNEEANAVHEQVRLALQDRLGVTLR